MILASVATIHVTAWRDDAQKKRAGDCAYPLPYEFRSPLCDHITVAEGQITIDYKTDRYMILCIGVDDGTAGSIPLGGRPGKRICNTIVEWQSFPQRLQDAYATIRRLR